MLTRLILKNFQRHKDLTINLDSVTALLGSTDCGKSSCLRALRWLSLNRPSGDSFIRRGAKTCSVELQVDGHTITRERGGGKNTYTLDSKEYAAFGQDVPEEIQKVLNLDEGNFQGQHAPAFWFSRTAGEVSRELNQIVNLSLIDSTLAALAASLRQARAVVVVSEQRLKDAEGKAAELAWTLDAEKDKIGILGKLDKLTEIRSRIAALGDLRSQGEKVAETLRNAAQIELDGAKAVQTGERLREIVEKRNRLNGLIAQHVRADIQRMEASDNADNKESEIKRLSKGRCPICGGVMK